MLSYWLQSFVEFMPCYGILHLICPPTDVNGIAKLLPQSVTATIHGMLHLLNQLLREPRTGCVGNHDGKQTNFGSSPCT